MASYESNPQLERPKLVASGPNAQLRAGHEPFVGKPGSWTCSDLQKLQGKWIACPGCTIDAYHSGHCHTKSIVDAFCKHFPNLEAPKFVSGGTKTILGKGGLHDVYVTRDAVFCGCYPPRASPHLRELGFKLKMSIFGNKDKMRKLKKDKVACVGLSLRPATGKKKRGSAPVLVRMRVGVR